MAAQQVESMPATPQLPFFGCMQCDSLAQVANEYIEARLQLNYEKNGSNRFATISLEFNALRDAPSS